MAEREQGCNESEGKSPETGVQSSEKSEAIVGATILLIAMIALIAEAKRQGKTLEQVLAPWDEMRSLAPALWRSGGELPSPVEALREKASKSIKVCPGYTDGRGVLHSCGKIVYREAAGGFTPDRCPECGHKHKNVKVAQAVKRQREKKKAAA
jgi:hypothetical protein